MIKFHKALGFYSKKLKWAPSITYLHRRDIFLRNINLLSNCKNVLEIGSGSGSILAEINRIYPQINTFSYDKSLKSKKLIQHFSPKSILINDLEQVPKKMDCIIFFEVMEHIEDDHEFLNTVNKLLSRDGFIFFSVPAHQSKWSVTDLWAGHFRRYEKNDLKNLIMKNNFIIERFYSYGFPICNLAHNISKILKKNKAEKISNRKELNEDSGVDRAVEHKIFSFISIFPFYLFINALLYFQILFFKYDFGIGYFGVAKKSLKSIKKST